MERYLKGSDAIFAMSCVRGRFVTVEKLNFSFYYFPRTNSHGPRVKVSFNPNMMRVEQSGTQKLCDDWSFQGSKKALSSISSADIKKMQQFFRKYLILFLLVWDFKCDEPSPENYLTGRIDFREFVENLDFYQDYSEELDKVTNVAELEKFCRNNDLVNFYGN